jgi:hypothetical protein
MKQFLLAALLPLASLVSAQDCSKIFISEYVEGYNNNKAIEIYNPTSQAVDLTQYQLHRWNNGANIYDATYSLPLTGSVAAKDVTVFVKDSTLENGLYFSLAAKADYFLGPNCSSNSTNRTFCWNGNDAITLERLDKTVIDIFGEIGVDPGNPTAKGGWGSNPALNYAVADSTEGKAWTTDHTLVRKASVKGGVTTNPSPFNVTLEWDSLRANRFDSLGTHTCACDTTSNPTIGIADNDYLRFEMAPNPTTDVVTVNTKENMTEIALVTFGGQVVARKKVSGTTAILSIKENAVATGIYLLQVRDESNRVSTKVLQVQSGK